MDVFFQQLKLVLILSITLGISLNIYTFVYKRLQAAADARQEARAEQNDSLHRRRMEADSQASSWNLEGFANEK